jgi:hypothetical protein
MSLRASEIVDRLYKLRAGIQSPEEREALEAAADALDFIVSIGKMHAFEDYRENLKANILPPPLCSFDTRAEADAWLMAHPEPPHGATVTIAGHRHTVAYVRHLAHRALLRIPTQEELDPMEEPKGPAEET